MWASGLKGADGAIANIVEYRADGKVKGTGNTTFISDGTPPMTDQYTNPSHNRVVHSSDSVAYGGGTRTNVSYIKQIGLANRERTLYISGTGRAQRYIGWDDTPANAPWYLNPWAWAQGRALNAGKNPQPKNIISESKSATEQGLVSSGSSSSSSSSNQGCSNVSAHNWCDDEGSCTTRSGSGVPGECGENYCCCAPSGSPMYNGGNSGNGNSDNSGNSESDGSNPGSGSSPGCSNDSEYDWCMDNGACTVGSGSGVPGPQCGHNYCRCP